MYFDDGIPVSTHVGVVDVQATNAETGSCRCRETGGSEPGDGTSSDTVDWSGQTSLVLELICVHWGIPIPQISQMGSL